MLGIRIINIFLFFQKEMFGIDLIIFCVSPEIDLDVLDGQQWWCRPGFDNWTVLATRAIYLKLNGIWNWENRTYLALLHWQAGEWWFRGVLFWNFSLQPILPSSHLPVPDADGLVGAGAHSDQPPVRSQLPTLIRTNFTQNPISHPVNYLYFSTNSSLQARFACELEDFCLQRMVGKDLNINGINGW